jgi:hypothetical protein
MVEDSETASAMLFKESNFYVVFVENITENQPEEYHSMPAICERKILTNL